MTCLGFKALQQKALYLSREPRAKSSKSSAASASHPPYPALQVLLPSSGARVIVASDGVWDAFEKTSRVAAMTRSWPTEVHPVQGTA